MDWIQKYLQNELTEEELESFRKRLAEDEVLADELETAIAMQARFKVEKKKHWRQLLAKSAGDPSGEARVVSIGSTRRFWLRRAAAILLIAVAALAAWWYIGQEAGASQIVAEALTEIHPEPYNPMGESATASKDWAEAIGYYQQKDFSRAAPIIKGLIASGQNEAEKYFYLGLCYLYQSPANYPEAVVALQAARKAAPRQYGEPADWYISLATLQMGQTEEAKVLLKKVVETGQWKENKARELLEKLESRNRN